MFMMVLVVKSFMMVYILRVKLMANGSHTKIIVQTSMD